MNVISERDPNTAARQILRRAGALAQWSRHVRYYALALLLVAAAALLRWSLPAVLGSTPFLAFYLAWVAAAAFGGVGPGLVATAASWLCVDLLFDSTPWQTTLGDPASLGRLIVLLAGGLAVSLVAERMRRSRIRLSESEERYRSLFANMLDGYAQCRMLFDEHGYPVDFVYLSVNDAFAHLTGLEDVVGKKATAVIPGIRESNPELFETYGRVARTGRPERLETEVKPLGIWFSISVYSARRGYFTAIFDNITERKQAQEALHKVNKQLQQQAEELQAQTEELQTQTEELRMQAEELTTANEELRDSEQSLRESEERFRAAYEQAAVGIEIVDLEGRLLYGNGWLSQMLGYREDELQQRTFAQITHPEDLPEELSLLNKLLRGEIPNYSIEKRYLHKDGHAVWVRVTSSLVHVASPYRVSIIEDITERRRHEEALRELNATLEDKVAQRTTELEHRARQLQKLTLELSEAEDRERRRLAEILHDDLQQVLAAAKFHLGLLSARIKNDPSQQAITAKLGQMLADAIAKSRSLSHDLSPVVLHHDDFTETLRWLAGQVQTQHGLTVLVEAPAELKVTSEALRTFLYKAAQELLFNVVKHARVNTARIRVRRLGCYIGLSVCDRGRGFDPREARQTAGFGLLSIRERVELLGGRMKMRSRKGQGSIFLLVIPDTREESEKVRTEEGRNVSPSDLLNFPPSALPDGRRLRILLADDHAIVREGLISLLSEAGDVEVVGEAANGREAINQAYRLEPDVIVMDVAMPLINGDDATRQIKTHLPQTRVIALSMYDETDMKETMYRAGAESYVLKTAPADELLAAIRGPKPRPQETVPA